MNQDVVLVDIMKAVVDSMVVSGISYINFEAGRGIQILKTLNDDDNSVTFKNTKYPLIAMLMPVREIRSSGYYATARIERIVIATITNSTDDVFTRYQTGGTFKSILYPCYYEFLRRLSQSIHIIGGDPDSFSHTKMDNPGQQPIGQGLTDYIDSIEILNLEIILNQIKIC